MLLQIYLLLINVIVSFTFVSKNLLDKLSSVRYFLQVEMGAVPDFIMIAFYESRLKQVSLFDA